MTKLRFNTTNYYSYDAPVKVEVHCEHGLAKNCIRSGHYSL